jgi:hypothetical protein
MSRDCDGMLSSFPYDEGALCQFLICKNRHEGPNTLLLARI